MNTDCPRTLVSRGPSQFSVASAMPVFGHQADASRTKEQTRNVPVQFVLLSVLTDAEVGRQVGYAGTLLGQNDAVRQRVAARIEADRKTLSDHVVSLSKEYEAPCPSGSGHPFAGVRGAS